MKRKYVWISTIIATICLIIIFIFIHQRQRRIDVQNLLRIAGVVGYEKPGSKAIKGITWADGQLKLYIMEYKNNPIELQQHLRQTLLRQFENENKDTNYYFNQLEELRDKRSKLERGELRPSFSTKSEWIRNNELEIERYSRSLDNSIKTGFIVALRGVVIEHWKPGMNRKEIYQILNTIMDEPGNTNSISKKFIASDIIDL